MNNINLKAFNEEMNMTNLDVLLNNIPLYSNLVSMSDLKLQEGYANFTITDVEIINANYMIVQLELKTGTREDSEYASMNVYFWNSQEENFESTRRWVFEMMASPFVYRSDLDVGDFALGDIYRIDFMRGNVGIAVTGRDRTEIIGIAEEIDRQILSLLE